MMKTPFNVPREQFFASSLESVAKNAGKEDLYGGITTTKSIKTDVREIEFIAQVSMLVQMIAISSKNRPLKSLLSFNAVMVL